MSRENAEEVWAYCERMGYEAGLRGPDTTNCHFTLFSTPERTQAWERGNAKGDAARASGTEEAKGGTMKPEPYDGPTGPADAMDGYTKEFGTLYAKAVDDMLAAIVQFEVATGRIVNQIELERLDVTRIASPAQEHVRHILMHFLPKPGEVAW